MRKLPPVYGVSWPNPAFGPAHPSFWAGQWRKQPYYPTFENYNPLTAEVEESEFEEVPDLDFQEAPIEGYSYQHPYWGTNYFYTPKRWNRWSGGNYRSPFMWSSYYRPWNYPA